MPGSAQGAVLGSSYYIAQFDIPGTWDSLVLGNDGGVITEELTLTGQYDSVAGMVADIGAAITNASATLP